MCEREHPLIAALRGTLPRWPGMESPVRVPETVPQAVLDTLVRQIVARAHPRRIILFGSAARGQFTSDSDLDVLVVMPNGIDRRRTAQELIVELAGLGVAKDIVAVTEDDVRDYWNNRTLVLYPALTEGRELYRAPE